mgnify:CR=1 FL=1
MSHSPRISQAVIRRLPRYYRYLSALQQMGIGRISSGDLSKRMGVAASQVRQDFSHFGTMGLQGYGYEVPLLLQEIRTILGLTEAKQVIIIGAGSLGQALAKYPNFERDGFQIVAIFDANPTLSGQTVGQYSIRSINELQDFITNHHVDIAALTVPTVFAREVCNNLVSFGVKGIWNFASVELDVPDDVALENIYLIDSLITLGYHLDIKKLNAEKQRQKEAKKHNPQK